MGARTMGKVGATATSQEGIIIEIFFKDVVPPSSTLVDEPDTDSDGYQAKETPD